MAVMKRREFIEKAAKTAVATTCLGMGPSLGCGRKTPSRGHGGQAEHRPPGGRRSRMEGSGLLRRRADQHASHRRAGGRRSALQQCLRRGAELLPEPGQHHHRTASPHQWRHWPDPPSQAPDALSLQDDTARGARSIGLQHRVRGQVARRTVPPHRLVRLRRAAQRNPAEGFLDPILGSSDRVHRREPLQRVLSRAQLHGYPSGRSTGSSSSRRASPSIQRRSRSRSTTPCRTGPRSGKRWPSTTATPRRWT